MDAFRTARLVAEKLAPGHLDDLVALHLDPEVSRYIGGVRSPEVTQAYLETNLGHWTTHGFGLWMLRTADGAFVGRAGLRHTVVADVAEVEVAYTLHRPFWGQGFASEVTQALIGIGFERLGLSSLVGMVALGNAASCHVLEKARFALETQARFNGELCHVYRLKRPD